MCGYRDLVKAWVWASVSYPESLIGKNRYFFQITSRDRLVWESDYERTLRVTVKTSSVLQGAPKLCMWILSGQNSASIGWTLLCKRFWNFWDQNRQFSYLLSHIYCEILPRTSQYFLVLLCTSSYFSVLLCTSWYFLVLLGTSVLLKYRSTLVPPWRQC
jgi:hypothetical protein